MVAERPQNANHVDALRNRRRVAMIAAWGEWLPFWYIAGSRHSSSIGNSSGRVGKHLRRAYLCTCRNWKSHVYCYRIWYVLHSRHSCCAKSIPTKNRRSFPSRRTCRVEPLIFIICLFWFVNKFSCIIKRFFGYIHPACEPCYFMEFFFIVKVFDDSTQSSKWTSPAHWSPSAW